MKIGSINSLAYTIGRLTRIIMRTFVFFFCTVSFALSSKSVFSQNSKVEINTTQTVNVDEVFNIIKKQTDFKFMYPSNLFADVPQVTLEKGIFKVSELLDKSLASGNFEYTISRKNVIKLRRSKSDTSTPLDQQTFVIEGTVSDEAGVPLPGASVFVATDNFGSNSANNDFIIKGTQTDFDGKFTLEVSLNQFLTVSSIGFEDYEQKITTEQRQYTIVLKESVNELDEVVLTGYTKTDIEKSVVAASKIVKRDLARQKVVNLDDQLQGLSPGLNINQVPQDGGRTGLELVLRGISTFDTPNSSASRAVNQQNSLNRQPLIVLDGFPYEGPFNDIDPQTVETIDVLRDASATAIWGLRASNGVIVITTKRGSTVGSKTRITFTSNTTIGTKQDLSNLGIADAATTIEVYNRRQQVSPFSTVALNAFNEGAFGRLARYARISAFDNIWADFYAANPEFIDDPGNPDAVFSPSSIAERDARLAELAKNNVLNDFERLLVSPGFITQNSLSISGGNSFNSYSFTSTLIDEKRPDVGDEFSRINLSLNNDINLSEKLKAVLDVSLASSKTNDNGIGVGELFGNSLTSITPSINIFDRLVDDAGNPLNTLDIYSGNREEFLGLGFDDPSFSPVLDQRLRDNETRTFNLRLAAGLNYKIADGLSADLKYQFNQITTEVNNVKPQDLFEIRTQNNLFISEVVSPENPFVQRLVPYGGTLENEKTTLTNTVLRGFLNYDKSFEGGHSVSALLGMEFSESINDLNRRVLFAYDDRTGLSDRFFSPPPVNSGVASYLVPDGSPFDGFEARSLNNFLPEITNRAVSTFTNVAYSYKNRYNANFSGKIDQASAFGINERLSKPLLWSVGASWNLNKEEFFKSEWIDNLKLRASYGKNGNLRRGLTTVVSIEFDNPDTVNNTPFARIASPGNPNLSFENTITTNLGLDFGFFNRIIGTLDVYDRQSRNLLTQDIVNPTFGQSTFQTLANNGAISNRGIELNLNIDFIKGEAFKWNTNLNISYNENKVLQHGFNAPQDFTDFFILEVENGIREVIGEDSSVRLRYDWAGLDPNGNPQVFNDNGDTVGFDDLGEAPTAAGLVTTKPFNAPGFGGLRNSFTYKNFTLSALATFKFGHVFQENLDNKYLSGFSKVFQEDIARAWQRPGDENFTDIPVLARNEEEFQSLTRQQFFTLSNYGIHDASHIRLRDITLEYGLDKAIVDRLGMTNANFTFQVRNLGLLWKANDVDLDPESVPFSGEASTLDTEVFPGAFRPGIRIPVSFVLGATLNF
ncbi:SusC/RagA family TonB-linked outer membrane protein [Maribacter sp. 2210JD10-5]|uniref:SusC/RagA family TonB-linked outer membrane protein n=1 Tax=Maribacter sp. 2210JD10-5 TaxID=3386272 RepID=UPI0039BC257B